MASTINLEQYIPGVDGLDYPTKISGLITALDTLANEIETARGTETTLTAQLTNFIQSTLGVNVDGVGAFKCVNMIDAVDAQDYVTLSQAQSTLVSSIKHLGVGAITADSMLVVNSDGTAVEGISLEYGAYTATAHSGATITNYANVFVDFNNSANSFSMLMPTNPVPGEWFNLMVTNQTTNIFSLAFNGDPVMGTSGVLGTEALSGTGLMNFSLKCVYINSTVGWVSVDLSM